MLEVAQEEIFLRYKNFNDTRESNGEILTLSNIMKI